MMNARDAAERYKAFIQNRKYTDVRIEITRNGVTKTLATFSGNTRLLLEIKPNEDTLIVLEAET